VEYLGHVIDKDGKRPSDSAIEAVNLLPEPKTLQQLQAFLGKINYYGKFVANLSQKAEPLYSLLKKSNKFDWNSKCQAAFHCLKDEVVQATRLCHYDSSKNLILATDASQYGIGAVLMQEQNGVEQPIAHASKTLTKAQKTIFSN